MLSWGGASPSPGDAAAGSAGGTLGGERSSGKARSLATPCFLGFILSETPPPPPPGCPPAGNHFASRRFQERVGWHRPPTGIPCTNRGGPTRAPSRCRRAGAGPAG